MKHVSLALAFVLILLSLAPNPASAAASLEVVSHHSYVDDIGYYNIVGEVRNNTDSPMEYVEIVATLYDDDGNMTGTESGFTLLDVVLPGGKSPFEISTSEWEGTTHYKLQVQGDPADMPRQDMSIVSHSSRVDRLGYLNIFGEVQNTGETASEWVQIVATLYDEADNVVGASYAFSSMDIIEPGETSPFRMSISHWEGSDHYILEVQAE